MKNYRIHFIRHGMTDGNEKGQYIGSRTDSELSNKGIKQLIDLKECYEYPAVGVVYASPMARCVQTTGVVYPGRELIIVPQLRELDFGDFEGQTIGDLREDEDYLEWLENSIEIAPPNGESGEDFLARIVEGIRFIIDDMMKSEIYDAAVVTHGGVIMTLMAAIGLPRRPMQEWLVGNGKGYTCFITPQIWLRDGLIEVAGIMPHGAENALSDGIAPDGIPTLDEGEEDDTE